MGHAASTALLTYSTQPRGGVVHTLALAEALHRLGHDIHVYALGDPAAGFYRKFDAPFTIVPAPPRAPDLETRVFDALDAFTDGLRMAGASRHVILHAQDCIAARAATRLRAGGRPIVVRTVHHVDDFQTPALVECQRHSILDPDHVLVVSRYWQHRLAEEFGIASRVVPNGVDVDRFRPGTGTTSRAVQQERDFLFLTVGGLEPRKGSLELVEALATVRAALNGRVRLAVVGGYSFQDHADYRQRALDRIRELQLDDALVLSGTVSDDELLGWYHRADAFVFPSVKEGWGLVILEAMATGLPVIASDIPVFREYLTDEDALLVPPHDATRLADAMVAVATRDGLRRRLAARGPLVARRHTWDASAQVLRELYGHFTDLVSTAGTVHDGR